MQTGIVIVDHGSRRSESNQMLEELSQLFAQRFQEKYQIDNKLQVQSSH